MPGAGSTLRGRSSLGEVLRFFSCLFICLVALASQSSREGPYPLDAAVSPARDPSAASVLLSFFGSPVFAKAIFAQLSSIDFRAGIPIMKQ